MKSIDKYKVHTREPVVTLLDVRATADGPPGAGADPTLLDGTEWCLTTFLLDGHHKVQAASEEGRPVRLLAFIAREPSIADEADIKVVLNEMESWGGD